VGIDLIQNVFSVSPGSIKVTLIRTSNQHFPWRLETIQAEATEREISNLGQKNIVASPMELGPEKDCAGEVQQ
jgi:hypothetical protein